MTGPQFSLRLEAIKKIFYDNEPELMVLLKTSVVVGAALLIVWAYRSARASIRHLCLTYAFAVMLLVPVSALIAPSIRFEIADPKMAVMLSLRQPKKVTWKSLSCY